MPPLGLRLSRWLLGDARVDNEIIDNVITLSRHLIEIECMVIHIILYGSDGICSMLSYVFSTFFSILFILTSRFIFIYILLEVIGFLDPRFVLFASQIYLIS